MTKIKGTTVTVYQRTKSGTDEFNKAIYIREPVQVSNVLVGEPTTEEINEVTQVHGKRLAYVLAIPKGDTHNWIDTDVEVFGRTFRTLGEPTQGIEENIPLSSNKKVRVVVND